MDSKNLPEGWVEVSSTRYEFRARPGYLFRGVKLTDEVYYEYIVVVEREGESLTVTIESNDGGDCMMGAMLSHEIPIEIVRKLL